MEDKNKDERMGIYEKANILRKALSFSLQVKGKDSIFVNVLGLFAAFLPVITARCLENLTNGLYEMVKSRSMEAEGRTVLFLFGLLISLYIVQSLFDGLSDYMLRMDTMRTERFVSQIIMECKCNVKFNHIENNDGFRQKLSFVEEYAGEYTARSMQDLILNVQRMIAIISVSLELFHISGMIVVAIFLTCIPSAVLSYMQSDATYRF